MKNEHSTSEVSNKKVKHSLSGHVKDIRGQQFGRLTVKSLNRIENRVTFWNCICSCGNEVVVRGNSLNGGYAKSCGCYQREVASRISKESHTIHGKSKTRLYNIWKGMRKRCNNPFDKNAPLYSARGIRVCDEWNNDFLSFYNWAMENGYNENLSIDRIDNDKGYCPYNCRFSNNVQQVRNRGITVRLTYNGETRALTEWCELFGLNKKTVYGRYHYYGWTDPKEILFGKEKRNA